MKISFADFMLYCMLCQVVLLSMLIHSEINCYETTEIFVSRYEWFCIPTTIHIVLMQGAEIIEALNCSKMRKSLEIQILKNSLGIFWFSYFEHEKITDLRKERIVFCGSAIISTIRKVWRCFVMQIVKPISSYIFTLHR